ncbi:MAG: NusG domain II-containing protein [Butyrivibrio sp.]|nr:NusG domain II-containing protein [Butyrivibrio sp.]
MEKRLLRKNDFYLIAALLLIFSAIAAYYFMVQDNGAYVKISIDGEYSGSFSLSDDTEYVINGYNGGVNTLVIRDGYAYLKDSSCPDHLCENMGRISKTGQSVICLPNRVVIEITKDDGENEYDTIVGALFVRNNSDPAIFLRMK